MQKDNPLSFCILILLFLYGCKTMPNSFYSYKVSTYTIDSVKHLLTTRSLVSFGDYLFEFRNRIKINSLKHGNDEEIVTSFKIDTISVYLMSNKSPFYFEFDTFELRAKIVQTGILTDKPFGVRFTLNSNNTGNKKNLRYSPPEKIIMNGVNCFYSEISQKDNGDGDSVRVKLLLVKNKNFNSIYKLNGESFSDNNYCIVGLDIYDFNRKQGLSEVIDALHPLTEKEKSICESMVQKSKTCITDTIKGLNIKQ